MTRNKQMAAKRTSFPMMLLFLFLAGILTSCQSMYYYRGRAVEKAREYALERLKDLPELQRDYIRYNTPVFMDNVLLKREKGYENKRDVMQTCLVWKVPDLEDSIVVVGVSQRRLNDWYPIRVLRKKFEKVDENRIESIAKARKFAMNKLLFLSNAARNRVRFENPRLYFTDFDIKESSPQKSKQPMVQVSFVWDSDDANQGIVVTGVGRDNLAGWRPISTKLRDFYLLKTPYEYIPQKNKTGKRGKK